MAEFDPSDEQDLEAFDESASSVSVGSRSSTPSVRFSSRCRPVTVESEYLGSSTNYTLEMVF